MENLENKKNHGRKVFDFRYVYDLCIFFVLFYRSVYFKYVLTPPVNALLCVTLAFSVFRNRWKLLMESFNFVLSQTTQV